MADAKTTGTPKRTAGTRKAPAALATATATAPTDSPAKTANATAVEQPRKPTPSEEWARAKPKPWDRMTATEHRVERWRRSYGMPNACPNATA